MVHQGDGPSLVSLLREVVLALVLDSTLAALRQARLEDKPRHTLWVLKGRDVSHVLSREDSETPNFKGRKLEI